MTLEEFLEKINKLNVSFYEKDKKSEEQYWVRDSYTLKSNRSKKPLSKEYFLYESWTTGGLSGGSCWEDGSHSHYATTGEKEPDFTCMDTILESLCPEISFIRYKKLVNEVVKYGEYTQNEYYGNFTNFGFKVVNLGDLYDKLKEMSLI